MGMSYEQAKKAVFKGFWILFGVTLLEVVVSLAGKGHIIPGLEDNTVIYALLALIIVILSLYKAYYIVYEFMHMRYEAKGLAMTVLLPTLLLVWAIIAFFQEGNSWGERRAQIQQKNQESVEDPAPRQEGMLLRDDVAPATF
jgi:hypothetical protein